MQIKDEIFKKIYNDLDEILDISILINLYCQKFSENEETKALKINYKLLHKKISKLNYDVLKKYFNFLNS